MRRKMKSDNKNKLKMIGRKNIGKNKLYGKSEKYMGKSGKMHFSLKVEELWTALYEMKCADR